MYIILIMVIWTKHNIIHRYILFIILILFIFLPLYPIGRFKHISFEDGLSQSQIFAILQDNEGFMWFGTLDGLNKYDGYRFTVYKRQSKSLNTLSDNKTQNLPGDTASQVEPLKQPDNVEVVYFHSTQRCKTCLYIEQRVVYVTETYFQDELDSGKIILRSLDLGEKDNSALISKYGAVSSQLYINTIVDGIDHIKHIEEVWFRDYLREDKVFDEMVQGYIERGLNGEL